MISIDHSDSFLFNGRKRDWRFVITTTKTIESLNKLFQGFTGHYEIGDVNYGSIAVAVDTTHSLWMAVGIITEMSIINIKYRSKFKHKNAISFAMSGYDFYSDKDLYVALRNLDQDSIWSSIRPSTLYMAMALSNREIGDIIGVNRQSDNSNLPYVVGIDDDYLLTAIMLILPPGYYLAKVITTDYRSSLAIPPQYDRSTIVRYHKSYAIPVS